MEICSYLFVANKTQVIVTKTRTIILYLTCWRNVNMKFLMCYSLTHIL